MICFQMSSKFYTEYDTPLNSVMKQEYQLSISTYIDSFKRNFNLYVYQLRIRSACYNYLKINISPFMPMKKKVNAEMSI